MTTGRLAAYLFRFQLRDLAVLRAGLPTLMAVFFGWMVVKTDGSRVDWNSGDGQRLAMQILTTFGTYVFIPLAAFLGAARLVTDDRANGYFRFLFSKPVSVVRFYVQQWVLYGVLVTLLAALLTAWLQTQTTALPVAGAMMAVALTWVLAGGVGFLLSAATNYDALVLLILWTVSKVLHAIKDSHPEAMWAWAREVTRFLIPTQKLVHAQNELLSGNPLPWPHTAHVLAYGLLAFAAGIWVLRRRELAR